MSRLVNAMDRGRRIHGGLPFFPLISFWSSSAATEVKVSLVQMVDMEVNDIRVSRG